MIRINGAPVALLMRTPGNDFELVSGWLVSEGVIASTAEIVAMHTDLDHENTVDVTVRPDVQPRRSALIAAAGADGVRGEDALRAAEPASRCPVADDPLRVDLAVLSALPHVLRAELPISDRMGGLHAAGLFSVDGRMVESREDVTRDHAVDKILGAALQAARLPLRGHLLHVTGGVTFDLVSKAAVAGVPVLSALAAPSNLAIELADRCGITVAGFSRGGGIDVYTRTDRVRFGR